MNVRILVRDALLPLPARLHARFLHSQKCAGLVSRRDFECSSDLYLTFDTNFTILQVVGRGLIIPPFFLFAPRRLTRFDPLSQLGAPQHPRLHDGPA